MKAKRYLILGLSLCLFLLGACAAAPQAYQRQNALQIAPETGGLPGAFPSPGANGIMGGTPTPDGVTPDQARADNIKAQLAGLKEIKDVNVVVIGNRCLVGYTPTDESANPTAIKNMVSDTCRQADRSIEGVTCGDTPGLNTRIAQIYNDAQRNKPADDLSSRFNDLVRMIDPSVRE